MSGSPGASALLDAQHRASRAVGSSHRGGAISGSALDEQTPAQAGTGLSGVRVLLAWSPESLPSWGPGYALVICSCEPSLRDSASLDLQRNHHPEAAPPSPVSPGPQLTFGLNPAVALMHGLQPPLLPQPGTLGGPCP